MSLANHGSRLPGGAATHPATGFLVRHAKHGRASAMLPGTEHSAETVMRSVPADMRTACAGGGRQPMYPEPGRAAARYAATASWRKSCDECRLPSSGSPLPALR